MLYKGKTYIALTLNNIYGALDVHN